MNGNVYYNNSERKFHFEKSQLDYPSTYSYNHIGHFKWDRTIEECIELGSWGREYDGGETTFYFANPDNLGKLQKDLGNEKWAVLSACEWRYVCEKLGECGWTVDDKTCFLIDTTPDKSLLRAIETKNGGKTMSKADFESYEAQGLVCLPAAGIHYDKAWDGNIIIYSYFYGQSSYGYYWSCTPSYTYDRAPFYNWKKPGTYSLDFDSSKASILHGATRGDGFAVRLVVLADEE